MNFAEIQKEKQHKVKTCIIVIAACSLAAVIIYSLSSTAFQFILLGICPFLLVPFFFSLCRNKGIQKIKTVIYTVLLLIVLEGLIVATCIGADKLPVILYYLAGNVAAISLMLWGSYKEKYFYTARNIILFLCLCFAVAAMREIEADFTLLWVIREICVIIYPFLLLFLAEWLNSRNLKGLSREAVYFVVVLIVIWLVEDGLVIYESRKWELIEVCYLFLTGNAVYFLTGKRKARERRQVVILMDLISIFVLANWGMEYVLSRFSGRTDWLAYHIAAAGRGSELWLLVVISVILTVCICMLWRLPCPRRKLERVKKVVCIALGLQGVLGFLAELFSVSSSNVEVPLLGTGISALAEIGIFFCLWQNGKKELEELKKKGIEPEAPKEKIIPKQYPFTQWHTFGKRPDENPEVEFVDEKTGERKTIVDDCGRIVDFPGIERGDWISSLESEDNLKPIIHFRTDFICCGANGYLMLWMVQPDGIYWADEYGFGMTSDPEILLYARLDQKGNFTGPFRVYSVGVHKYYKKENNEDKITPSSD